MIDFTQLSRLELAQFIVHHQAELDAGGIDEHDVLDALATGRAALETRPYGFAIVEQKPTTSGKSMPHLWLVYIAAEHRSSRQGSKFVRELLVRYASDYHMSLYCYGSRRRAFFGRLGFRIESRDGEMRRMTTNTEIR